LAFILQDWFVFGEFGGLQPEERMLFRWKLLGPTRRDGQAMLEYLVIAGMLLASLAVLTLFLVTFKEYGYRILDMVSSDYP
jgi:hypothetical protein